MYASYRFDELLRMRLLMILAASAALSACSLVYKLPTRQGNVIEQKQLDKLEIGMTREQVQFLLGTPLAASPFTDDRWDYLGYYRSPRGSTARRLVTLRFDGNELVSAEGIVPPSKQAAEAAEPESVRKDSEALGQSPVPDSDSEIPEEIVTPGPEDRGP